MTKAELRQSFRLRRQHLSAPERQAASRNLVAQFLEFSQPFQRIALYHAAAGELDLQPLAEYLSTQDKDLYQPVAYRESRLLDFERYRSQDPLKDPIIFYPGGYQLTGAIARAQLDLVLVPLVAIDHTGQRLGQGGGYYDASFAARSPRPILCGVGYDWQLVAPLPQHDWDVAMDYFISDTRLIRF